MSDEFKISLPDNCGSVLCGVSGGADSVFMLHVLKKLCERRKIKICAAHFEHGIRGDESMRDAAFVAEMCENLGIECMIGHGSVPEYATQNHIGLEEAARKLRYEFLEEAREKFSCDYIATAHNADDNAETMLFNLARGAGGKGLCGIPQIRGNIIRPILGITRDEIEEYLRLNNIPHVEDSTNASDDYSRNLIRHRVMPTLKEINPAFSSAVSRTAELLRRDEECLSKLAEAFIEKNYDGESVPAKDLYEFPDAIASRVIRQILEENVSFVHINAVLALARKSGLGYADICGRRICADQGRIYFNVRRGVSISERPLVIGGATDIPEAEVKIKTCFDIFNRDVNDSLTTLQLKYENICHDLSCSGRKNGDKFAPADRGCTKTLKSLFLERKMTQAQRDKTVVIRDGESVAAVIGFGIDEKYKCSDGDKVLKIEIESI
jgi:tRNA(Ile)-lysidine synthase